MKFNSNAGHAEFGGDRQSLIKGSLQTIDIVIELISSISLYFLLVLFGSVLFLVYLAYLVFLCPPILLYRFILSRVIAPWYHPDIGEIVADSGQAFAAEFIGKDEPFSSRFGTATCCIMEGTVPREEWRELVKSNWINAKVRQKGRMTYQYMEFQQYIEYWLGFMFWKMDRSFNLDYHLYFHDIPKSMTNDESHQFLNRLMEQLLNKPFIPKRSPWELHIVQNYRDPELLKKTNEKQMTAIIFRSHHSLADGFSVLSLFLEDLFGIPVAETTIASAKPTKKIESITTAHLIGNIFNFAFTPVQLLHDIGNVYYPLFKKKVPWFTPDARKSWKQSYQKSPIIPIEKIKAIKNKLGVSFTTVLVSILSAGVAKDFKRKGYAAGKRENTCIGIAIPLPNHPKKLMNYFAGMSLDLPIEPNLDPVQRIGMIHKNFEKSKHSLLTKLVLKYRETFIFSFAHIASFWTKNQVFSSYLTNFPGPGNAIQWKGKRFISGHFAVVPLHGVAGVGFMILSFNDHIQLVVTAENAVMSREDLEYFVCNIRDEIDKLYEVLVNSASN